MELKINIINTNVSLFGTYRCSRKLLYSSSQRYVIFMRDVPQTFAPHFVRRSKLSAERCAHDVKKENPNEK